MEESSNSTGFTGSVSPLRWIVFGCALIFGVVALVGTGMYYPPEVSAVLLVFYIPLIAFILWVAYRWAQGRELVHTDEAEDEQIFRSMRKHALPVQFIPHADIYQCPECEHRFDIVGARLAENEMDVVLCPNCGVRLHVPDF